MNKTILKFALTSADYQEIEIDANAKFLDIQVQHQQPYLWVLVDSKAPKILVKIRTVSLNDEFIDSEEYATYIATYTLREFVFHVFTKNW